MGRRLAQAGPEINFLIRHRRAAELSQRRLRIVDGTRTQTIDALTVTVSSLAGPYDLVRGCCVGGGQDQAGLVDASSLWVKHQH